MLESFLKEVENTLIDQVYEYFEKKKSPAKSRKIKGNALGSSILQMLKDPCRSSAIVIPTDKTNKFVAISFYKYTKWMLEHISKCRVETSRCKLTHFLKNKKNS